MNDTELNRILKQCSVPERPIEFWEDLSKRISARIHWGKTGAQTSPERFRRPTWHIAAWAAGGAALCLLLAALYRAGNSDNTNSSEQLAVSRKCFHELEGLFPNQIQAIVFDQEGPHLALADSPNVPTSPPLYLRICGPGGCQSIVTFSGQRIRVNGIDCDVLVDHRGDILVVGQQFQWSSDAVLDRHSQYRIEARPLEAAS